MERGGTMTPAAVELSYREKRILTRLFEGRNTKNIAKLEGVGMRTVETVIMDLSKKIAPEAKYRGDFNVRIRIVHNALQLGLIEVTK